MSSSSLEIVVLHLPTDVAPDHAQSEEFIDGMKYVRSQKGNKSVRWGRAVGQNVTICFFEWESLDDYHLWQKEPSYKTFREFWTNFAHSPATGVPPLEMRHLNIPIAKMEHVLSKKFVEIAIEGEHHVDHDHQGKPHFNGKVIEGSGKGKSITLTGMDDPHEGWKALQANHEAVYKVALSQIA